MIVEQNIQQTRKLAAERHKARHFAMQAVYQWQMTGHAANVIEAQFRVDHDMKGTDLVYFRDLLKGVQANSTDIDAMVEPLVNQRDMEECDAVTRALLRVAAFELMYRIDVPYKVVINEAINLAKKFGPDDSHKFINGILDQAARQTRKLEIAAAK